MIFGAKELAAILSTLVIFIYGEMHNRLILFFVVFVVESILSYKLNTSSGEMTSMEAFLSIFKNFFFFSLFILIANGYDTMLDLDNIFRGGAIFILFTSEVFKCLTLAALYGINEADWLKKMVSVYIKKFPLGEIILKEEKDNEK